MEIVSRLSLHGLKHCFYWRRDHLSAICAQVLPTSRYRGPREKQRKRKKKKKKKRRKIKKEKRTRGRKRGGEEKERTWPTQEAAVEQDSLSDWASEWICKEKRVDEKGWEREKERGSSRLRRKRTKLARGHGVARSTRAQRSHLYFSYFPFSLHLLFLTPFTPRSIRLSSPFFLGYSDFSFSRTLSCFSYFCCLYRM